MQINWPAQPLALPTRHHGSHLPPKPMRLLAPLKLHRGGLATGFGSCFGVACGFNDMSKQCADEYDAHWNVFFDVSGAQVTGNPLVNSGNIDESWMERRFHVAETQLQGCWAVGGRYWEVVFRTADYIDGLRLHRYHCNGWEADAWGYACAEWWNEFQFRWNALPSEVTGGFCAPSNCTTSHMRTLVFPRFLAHSLRMSFDVPAPSNSDIFIQELGHWSEYRLDFVIGGLNSCGTTSLYTNLAANADIDFTIPDGFKEDGSLFRNNRVLPYAVDVAEFNNLWRATGRREPKLRGLAHPELFRTLRVRQALLRMDALKVIFILCDPVSRFEKLFWLYYYCPPGMKPSADRLGVYLDADGTPRCWNSVAGALEEPALLERWRFGPTLRGLQRAFPSRLHLVHQEALRSEAKEVFRRLAAFLGAQAFPNGMHFQRANAVYGPRTGLCRNTSLLLALQERLAPEYEAIEAVMAAAGLPLPEELRLRRTRCDRAEELAGAVSERPPA